MVQYLASDVPILCFQTQGGDNGQVLNYSSAPFSDAPNILAGVNLDASANAMPIGLTPDANSTFADVNGDGLPDWVEMFPNRLEIRLGHGDGAFGTCPDGSML